MAHDPNALTVSTHSATVRGGGVKGEVDGKKWGSEKSEDFSEITGLTPAVQTTV
jgi:hypothetical protein